MSSQSGTISVLEWIITFILLAIPIVNFIMLLVWALGGNVNKSKKNFAIAGLIMMAISILFYIGFFATLAPYFRELINEMPTFSN